MADRPTPSGLFTASEARAAGWTPAAQRHAVASGRWQRHQPGVFEPASAPDPRRYERLRVANLRAAQAAAVACRRAALSHSSAAIAWGLPVLGRAVTQPCLTVQSGTALRSLAHVHLHRATLDEILTIDGQATMSAARACMDLAREHGVFAGVAATDAALHSGLVSSEQLKAVVEFQRRWPGATAAKRVLALADGLSESPLESISRLRMHEHRIPPPVLQARICDQWGIIVARADFYWPQFGVIGEADGALKWRDRPTALEAQNNHTYDLEELGLIVVRWGWRHVSPFDGVARRLRLAFERGAEPGSPQRKWQVRRA